MPDQFLKDLLATPGTSGFEQDVQDVVREYASPFADETWTDVHGNVLCTVNETGAPRILLDAHCDQIGLIVRHIDENGFLRVNPVGGWDMQILLGQRMLVHTHEGSLPGVIARKPIHLLKEAERKTVPQISELWIDIGCRTEAETRELVRVGDSVTPEPALRDLKNGRLSGTAMDDRTGVWVVFTALRLIHQAKPTASVTAVSSVQEEIGLRGATTSAYNVNPHVAIAVDVTHATDCPGIDQNEHGRITLGGGPVIVRGANANPRVVELLTSRAQENEIPFQLNAVARAASNDAATIQISRGGCATGLVTIPNRYMHSPVEVVEEADLHHAAQLIAEFCLSIDEHTSFIP